MTQLIPVHRTQKIREPLHLAPLPNDSSPALWNQADVAAWLSHLDIEPALLERLQSYQSGSALLESTRPERSDFPTNLRSELVRLDFLNFIMQ